MSIDQDDPTIPRRSRPWLTVLILIGIAFAGGAIAMGYLFNRSDRVANWLGRAPVATPAPVMRAVARPVPAADPQLRRQALALTQRLDLIERHIGQIDTRTRAAVGNADRAEGLLVAFAARRALDRGAPLGYIEALLRDRFGGTQPQAVAAIIGAARQPITIDQLRTNFETAAPQLIVGESGDGWWAGVRRELGALFVVRHAGTPSAASVDRVARARTALDAGQADAALAEVARMPARDAAAVWIRSARRYVSARNALDAIETAALLTPEARRALPEDQPMPDAVASPEDGTSETL